ncbi:MAG: hypothetical protein R3F31_01250 [Verrucomicrobiales bacterium]
MTALIRDIGLFGANFPVRSAGWGLLLSTVMMSTAVGSEPGPEPGPLVRCFAAPSAAVPPFVAGRFDPRPGETIALVGGSRWVEESREGTFETLLHLAYPDRDFRVRSLSWQGDSVYAQSRPHFFYTATGDDKPGSVPDQRERVVPGIIVAEFGRMESLDGRERLPEFVAAYELMVTAWLKLTPRIVLVSPPPFFAVGPAASLAEERNRVLASYSEAIADLAKRHGCLHADLFKALDPAKAGLSRDGVALSAAGQKAASLALGESLGFGIPASMLDSAEVEPLRQAVQKRHLLWQQHYRPTNWAFLFGDRQHVPSSRDHLDEKHRWFVEEMGRLPGMLSAADADITRLAREASP